MTPLAYEFEEKYDGIQTAQLIRDEFNKKANHLQKNIDGLRSFYQF